MKRQVEEWYFFADKDLLAAFEIINNPGLTNIVAFLCQQAVEKYLKAFMSAHDITMIRIHDLVRLYDIRLVRQPGWLSNKSCSFSG